MRKGAVAPLLARCIAVHWEFKAVRTLEEAGFSHGIVLHDLAQAPVAPVGRMEAVVGVFLLPLHGGHRHPLPGGLVPHHLGVPVANGDLLRDKIAGILGERATVDAVGDALDGGIARGGWFFRRPSARQRGGFPRAIIGAFEIGDQKVLGGLHSGGQRPRPETVAG